MVLAAAIGGIVSAVLLIGLAMLFMGFRFRRGMRNPDSVVGSRSMLTKEYAEKPFEKPRDESGLL